MDYQKVGLLLVVGGFLAAVISAGFITPALSGILGGAMLFIVGLLFGVSE
jgi:hypothetical protein